MTDDIARRLVDAARAAARHAHAPYSRFAVGAALLMRDGSLVTGANVENASYGLSLCAETVAIATASAQGRIAAVFMGSRVVVMSARPGRIAEVVAIGVVGGPMDAAGVATGIAPVSPCGRCRQVLNEAAQLSGVDLPVHCGGADGTAVTSYRLSALLPDAFGPADLGFGAKR